MASQHSTEIPTKLITQERHEAWQLVLKIDTILNDQQLIWLTRKQARQQSFRASPAPD